MLVVGIDPGTATTGYGFVRDLPDGSLEAVDFGVIRTSPDQRMSERLLELHTQLNQRILLHHPASGAVEKLFLSVTLPLPLLWDRRAGSFY